MHQPVVGVEQILSSLYDLAPNLYQEPLSDKPLRVLMSADSMSLADQYWILAVSVIVGKMIAAAPVLVAVGFQYPKKSYLMLAAIHSLRMVAEQLVLLAVFY